MEEKKEIANQKASVSAAEASKLRRRKCLPCLFVFIIVVLAMAGFLGIRAYYLNQLRDEIPPVIIPTVDPVPEETTPAPSTGTKKSTGKSNPTPTPVADTSAADREKMINFFVETAVYNTDKSRELEIIRWTKPLVSVGVAEGVFDDSLNSCLNSYIGDFNQLSSGVDLARNDTVDLGVPNIKIYYWAEEPFNERAQGSTPYAYVEWKLNDDYSLTRALMFVSYKVGEMEPAVKCQVIRHEMSHAVGFWGHSDIFFESIMALPKTRYLYPTEDKRMIELLYNIGLPLNSNDAATRAYLGAHYPY